MFELLPSILPLAQVANEVRLAPELSPGGSQSWLLPPQVTTSAASVDVPFHFILAINIFFFLLITVLTGYFLIRYRRRRPDQPAGLAPSHHTHFELAWSFIPLVLVVDMFYLGFRGYVDMAQPPTNAMQISVSARKWSWSFTYPNGHTDSELHVPVNQPIELLMDSSDVIHSFFVPAFRLKKDVVPGRFTKAWFEANKPGEYVVLCAEYCGTDHSNMWTKVVVHEPGGYEQWLEAAADPFQTRTPLEVGEMLYTKLACVTCHSIDGTQKVGPSLQGVFGRQSQLTDGRSATADENYLRNSMLTPQVEVVAGFQPVMPTFQGLIKDRELEAIIEYIKTLK